MKYRWKGVAAVALIAVLLAGCSVFGSLGKTIGGIFTPNRANDFQEANLRLKAEETKYTAARLRVVDSDGNARLGVLTAAQYAIFQVLEQNVIDANGPVNLDILEWQRTNTKPVSFNGHAATLRKAQDALIAYVNKETAKVASVADVARMRLMARGITPEEVRSW